MNFRRLLVSSSHRVCTTVAAPASAENFYIWKRACTTIGGPVPASVEASVPADLLAKEKAKEAAKVQRKKRKMLEELRINLGATRGTVKERLNAFTTREKEYGVSITQADLVRWAKRLDMDGKHEHAYEIFEWMEGKKMTFSPSQLATFVDLIYKTKGVGAALDYFDKVDPDFDNMDAKAKNWPAYQMTVKCIHKSLYNTPFREAAPAVKCVHKSLYSTPSGFRSPAVYYTPATESHRKG